MKMINNKFFYTFLSIAIFFIIYFILKFLVSGFAAPAVLQHYAKQGIL